MIDQEAQFFDRRSFDPPEIRTLVERYRALALASKYPDLAARAAQTTRRASKMLEIYEGQTAAFESPEYITLSTRLNLARQDYRIAAKS